MSAGLNTVSGTIYEDFVQMFLKGKKLSETKQNVIIKLTTLILGIFCILMVFLVEKMGAIFQVSLFNSKHIICSFWCSLDVISIVISKK